MAPIVPHPRRIKTFASGRAFESWLAAHHDSEPEIWIKMHKKSSGLASVTPAEALDVALCWGWIDATRKSFDARSFLQRYTPRGGRAAGARSTGRGNQPRAAAGSAMSPDAAVEPRFMDLPAGRMHYVDQGPEQPGRNETLLFVHGTPTWSYEWRHLIRDLSKDYRCVAPDHLGFGWSDRPRGFAYTPEAHSRNLLEFARRLDLADVTLVVHDYGGPIGLPLCIESPERVTRLVLVNTWMWSFEGDADMEKKGRIAGSRLGRLLYRHANFSLRVLTPSAYGDRRKLTPDVHKQYLDRFPDAWSRGAVLWALAKALLGSSAFYRDLWEQRGRLHGRPALLVWGMKDPAFGPRFLRRWQEELPGSAVTELPKSGHWPHEEEPERVIQTLREFLQAG